LNYENNDMLTSPNLSYTSRDFKSIYDELLKSIPQLTRSWSPEDENDPGIVLLKLISMLGDMLSYNQDKQALEAFPRTVTQRSNARQLFRLIGYKMHWWRSAIVELTITNANSYPIYMNKFMSFATANGDIKYTLLDNISIPGGTYASDAYKVRLVQGTPITPIRKSGVKPTDYNANWHDAYDYNVDATKIVNNRIYFNQYNIDETSVMLVDNDETPFANNEWTLVENINLSTTMDKVFELDVDVSGIPFIILPTYWNTKYVITKFKIFAVVSDGKNGEIEENVLTQMDSSSCYVMDENVNISTALENVTLFNTASTYGCNPETCIEARKNAENYINTIDTLVILRDFEKAVNRIESVANVIATDIQTDPYANEMTENQVNLYIVRKNDYNDYGSDYIYAFSDVGIINKDELFKENIIGELQSYKTIPTNINVYLENYVDWIDWSINGQIFLRKPINIEDNNSLMNRINDNLIKRFNCETLDFNEPVNYMDVIECIMKTDKNIWHVDLNTSAVQYRRIKRSIFGNPTGFVIKNKYMIYNENHEYTGYYMTSLGCTSVELEKLSEYEDVYKDVYDNSSEPIFKPNSTTNIKVEVENDNENDNNITPGGDGYGKNAGNRIIREDGLDYTIGLFGVYEPREYEIYNKRIYNWTGLTPVFTGYVINTDDAQFKIQKYNLLGELEDTNYTIEYDSRMYMPDGSDAHRKLKLSYRQIDDLCKLDPKLSYDDILKLSDDVIKQYVDLNVIREVWDIVDNIYNESTGEIIDRLTGEIFIKRGEYWYSKGRSYDENTGVISDMYGEPIVENDSFIFEPACREDITGEYIQLYDIHDDQTEFNFFLGQDFNGNPIKDSIGNIIKAYPIKPYSLFIYINGDEEILADTGSGNINGTPGLLNGQGSIDYSTGHVQFKLNKIPTSIKIMFKVNKLTYSRYANFNNDEFFVRPEFIRNDNRK